MRRSSICIVLIVWAYLLPATIPVYAGYTAKQTYYQLTVYHFTSKQQETTLTNYLQLAWLPAVHRFGVKQVGVFTAIENDTAADKKIYVLIPFASLKKWEELGALFLNDKQLAADGAAYFTAAYNESPYTRMENMVLKALMLFNSTPKSGAKL